MGVKDIGLFNISLLLKWKWRILNDMTAIWSKLIDFRYHSFGIPSMSRGFHKGRNCDSILWRDLSNLGCDDGSSKDCFRDNLRCILGKGSDVDFWSIRWLCSQSIKEVFPELHESHLVEVDSELSATLYILWNTSIPSKFLLFYWTLLLDRLSIKDNLLHRGIIDGVSVALCVLCYAQKENSLIFSYPLWLLSLCGGNWTCG
ncbi:hypothetical protein KIW84_060486 [Lathyrus oleraceus]|uniref:Reverse transcriptase zinc-binding domain-containing protein n=1 Tax=Pisum sativum TaxID=3888 RepID=A0A9D4W1G9_PEA|nr:hypothetical protein KIW84_060486 [Pisum sativum]